MTRSSPTTAQPIVIFGGFLSFTMLYWDMHDALAQLTGQPVHIVEMRGHDWIPSIAPPGWIPLLRKLERTVHQAVRESPTGKVTLIGHSAGGLLGRLYLSPKPFLGHTYRGLEYVDHLITLGTPHYDRRKLLYGGWLTRWVNNRYPGAYFAPQVKYTSVAGKVLRGNPHGNLRERHVYVFYKEVLGEGEVWGDGLVPVESALLEGAQQIILEGVSHFTGFGGPWYGAAEVVPRWWNIATQDHPSGEGDKVLVIN
ncbi:MAG: alpha/beta fold hydrolase [Anaerolineae bacterium]|nr:alpha/beta fold hydrolase [Anaerolineae bacterium]